MNIALYPGTFDPITLGHLDVIKTASEMFDEVVVAVMINPTKNPLFTVGTRIQMIESAVRELGIERVRAVSSDGLSVNAAKAAKAKYMIRGLRLTTDYEQELFLLLNNQVLAPGISTILIPPKQEHLHISSTAVRTLLDQEAWDALKTYVTRHTFGTITFGR